MREIWSMPSGTFLVTKLIELPWAVIVPMGWLTAEPVMAAVTCWEVRP